jgi:choloylglycine hydrolase
MNAFKVAVKLITAVVGLVGFNSLVELNACTGIQLVAKDRSVVHGRTLEFGIEVPTSVVVIPRGFEFKGSTPKGPGLSYKAKYAAVGAIAFDNLSIMDGINEKGLAAGAFFFPGYAEYSTITQENQSKALSPVEFSNWLITQFASVDEVKASLANVIIAPTVTSGWGDKPPPFHYIVYDIKGNSLVIEPVEGKLLIHDNKLGVITNSPKFDWHMTNLRNYINLKSVNASPLTIDGLEFSPFGQGSGLVGLPGDFTPPSRFVRAAFFTANATPSDNSNQGVWQVFHILNQFDIPVGTVRAVENGITHTDSTLMTCARDPAALKYYFKTYEDQTVKMVDLKAFDWDAKGVKRLPISGKQVYQDLSADLK